ncbi:helix-turn-helix domain-containing protein, partial [Acinetobacter baumannii]
MDTHVSRLRSKLDLTEANGYTITAIYGMGYRLDVAGAPLNATVDTRPGTAYSSEGTR